MKRVGTRNMWVFFPWPYLHVVLFNLKPIICHVLAYCFGSFLLQDLFLSLPVLCHRVSRLLKPEFFSSR